MNKVYACIDGLSNTDAVIDWAAWAALQIVKPLEFLHVLERHPERAEAADFSGTIGPDAQNSLLQELSDKDGHRSKLAREVGRSMLAAARERASAAGVVHLDSRLRHGDFVDTIVEMESDAALFVLGKHHRTDRAARLHPEHHLERAIRAVQRPVLVAASEAFEPPRRIVLALDGSANARRAVDALSRHAVRAGLPVLVVMVGVGTTLARRQLDEARIALTQAGVQTQTELVPGEPQQVLPGLVKVQGAALLVMGACGHSRLRQFIVGSTTSTLLRVGDVPVLILR
jgi:nucleotide-binding universal stress UspA family protein